MDSRVCRCKFENEGRYFALITPDGRLKVWDCASGKLKHDIAPDSHLGGSRLTCVSWRSSPRARSDYKKRKKRKSNEDTPSEQDGVAIGLGTAVGIIFIFDVLSGEIKTSLKGGHDDRVNDLNWNKKTDLLYSCSDDRHITEWSVESQEVKCKWKADKTSVHSIQISPKGDCLLSAGRDIRLWDIKKKEILKKFTGHATSISHLLFTPLKTQASASGEGDHIRTDGYYFLSGAEQDRFLNAWKVDLQSKDKSSIVSFALSDEPVSLEITYYPNAENPLHLIVVSKDGHLHIFEQSLNGYVKKPLNPKTTLQLATPGTKDVTPEPVPIICARFVDSTEPSILIAYGSPAKPEFEILKYKALERNECLVRDYKSGLLLREENNNQRKASTNKAQVKQNSLTTLGTENMVLARPSLRDSGSSTKTKGASTVDGAGVSQELSMEDRLKSMNVTPSVSRQSKDGKQSTPKVESMTQMLVQALNSQDKRLLEEVLSNGANSHVMQKTVKRLPVNYLLPFVTELVHKIQASPSRGSHLVPWLKNIMTQHMSYLMSLPNLVDSLGGLYQMFESRVMVYSRLCKLQGRLDLMLSQVSAQTEEVVEEEQLAEPMVVYKEEESDEMSDTEEFENHTSEEESMKEDISEDGDGPSGEEDKQMSASNSEPEEQSGSETDSSGESGNEEMQG